MQAAIRSLILLALCLTLFACAKQERTLPTLPDASLAVETWGRFHNISERAEHTAGPFSINATLYYAGKEGSQRVTAYVWGNGQPEAPLPLRLDILLGPGSVLASAAEETRGTFIYVPRDNMVYHTTNVGLAEFGVPLPFSLASLTAILTGRYAEVFKPAKNTQNTAFAAVNGKDNTLIFPISDAPLAGKLTLSRDGLPVAWSEEADDGWRISLEYWPDSTRTTPRKLSIKHGSTAAEATLIMRELTFPQKPFRNEQLRLNVPPNTRLAPLAVAL